MCLPVTPETYLAEHNYLASSLLESNKKRCFWVSVKNLVSSNSLLRGPGSGNNCSPWKFIVQQRSPCSPWRTSCHRRRICLKEAVIPWEAYRETQMLAEFVAPWATTELWRSLFLENCTLWQWPALEQFIKNCTLWKQYAVEKSMKDSPPLEGSLAAAGDELRKTERQGQHAMNWPHLPFSMLYTAEGKEVENKEWSWPIKKGGVVGKYF